MSAAEWGEAHRMEAWHYLCEGLRDGLPGDLLSEPLTLTEADIATEQGFRRAVVRWIDIDGQGRALKRVRDHAEGRLMREAGRDYWIVAKPEGYLRLQWRGSIALPPTWEARERATHMSKDEAESWAANGEGRAAIHVRVTRVTRRAK